MKIEVLVSTMYQKDRSLPKKMNIQTDAVIVNQCDEERFEEFDYNGHRIRMISTTERGLSKSRNMALSYAEGDVCLLADEDLCYDDGYAERVEEAFAAEPNADVMVFNARLVNAGERTWAYIEQHGEVPKNKYYSSVRIALRLERIRQSEVRFNELFGAGATYTSGEESLFLRQARQKGLRVFQNTAMLSAVDCSASTWFNGFDEKYYFDKGAFLAAAYGKWAFVYKWYFILKSRKISKLGFVAVNRKLKEGIRAYRKQAQGIKA